VKYDQAPNDGAFRTTREHTRSTADGWDRVIVEIGAYPSGVPADNSELQVDRIDPEP